MIERDEGFFTGVSGVRVFHRSWVPTDVVRGRVTIAHGYAEHGDRYEHVARRLTERGIAVSALDHRGHGQSGGPRTNVRHFSEYTEDLLTFLDLGAQRWPGVRSTLLGHSMGGLIALDLAVEHRGRVDALVLSAPAACAPSLSNARVKAGRVVSRLVPRAPVMRLPLHDISRDPEVVRAYNHDPLVFRGPVKARLGAEWLVAIQRVEEKLPSLRTPLLVMQGGEDKLVDPGCGPHIVERAGSPDKTLRMYPGLWHEILNEPERDRVISDMISWITERAGITV